MGGAERLALVCSGILSSENNRVELIINENNGKFENVLLEEIPKNIDYKFMSSEDLMHKINNYKKLMGLFHLLILVLKQFLQKN
jgi:hypothetical protein